MIPVLCLIVVLPTMAGAGEERGKVVRVVDGNTLVVRLGGAEEKVRLLGVDSAEQGSRFTWYLVRGKRVTLLRDKECQDRDEDGRLLRYVHLQDGTFINAEIIKRGFGRTDTARPFTHGERFQAYERHARKEGLGQFWANAKGKLISPEDLEAGGEDTYLGGLGGVSMPVLIPASRIQPNYPEMARKTGLGGRAIVQFVVLRDGTVGDIWILQSPSRELGFDEAAIAAVRQWRYQPGVKDGHPVDAHFTALIDFVLQ